MRILDRYDATGNQRSYAINVMTDGAIYFIAQEIGNGSASNLILDSQTDLSDGTWYHIAVVRYGSNWYLFIDGVVDKARTSAMSVFETNTPVLFGKGNSADLFFTGHIDEFRFSNLARWTTNFTPPAQEY